MANRVNIEKALIDEAVSTISALRKRVAELEKRPAVGDAISKSLKSPAQADTGRNRAVTKIMNDGIFQEGDPLQKSKADKRADARAELRAAKGLSHADDSTSVATTFQKSRGARVQKGN
jgi:hypothetical protein